MRQSNHIYSYPLYYEVGFCTKRLDRKIKFIVDCYKAHRKGSLLTHVLDNGCGTGLYLEKLANLGIDVTGYDVSPQMVEYASARFSRMKVKSHFFESDLRHFKTRHKSDMAICTYGSFQYLQTADDIVRHLKCVARALKPHGLYLVTLPSIQEFIANPPGSLNAQWSKYRGGVTVEVDFTYRQQPIDWTTQTFAGAGRIKVNDNGKKLSLWLPYKYRIFSLQEINALVALSRCFEIVEVYGGFHISRIY